MDLLLTHFVNMSSKTYIQEVANPMERLFSYLRPQRTLFYRACSASIVNKIFDLMPPLLVGWVIDSVRRQPPQWISYLLGDQSPWIIAIFLSMLAVIIFGVESLFEWMLQSGFMQLSQKVQHNLRMDAYHQIQSREIEFFENHRMGETMAMLNDDVNQLERFLNTGFNDILQLLVLFVFSGLILLTTSWQLAMVGLLPIPIIIWGSFLYQKLISPRYQKVRQAVGELSSRLENNISGILVIKSFTAEQFESKRVEKASLAYQEANFQAIRYSALYVPMIRMAVALGFGGVLLLGSYWVLEDAGVLSVGELVLFSMMVQRLLWPLTRLGTTFDEYERAKASAKRTFGLLDTPSQIVDPQTTPVMEKIKGDIEFQQASFQYQHGNPVLDDFQLSVLAGQTIGIVGLTGAGKTTLIKLLLRLYDVSGGKILLDQVDIRHLKLADLRQQIALVSQDVYLFHGTVFENIAYGVDASKEEVQKAAALAQLDGFVQTLPKQYDTLVGERGIKLSGGQRQRLSIARAILKNAPIMIFDEATSSVDTETEKAIQQNLLRLTKGKTALVIAHRLSTIRHADRIIVLGEGKVLEEGTHEELLSHRGHYAELWNIQSGQIEHYT